MRRLSVAILAGLVLALTSDASAASGRAGTTAGNALLRGTPGARPAGMGGAFAAVAEGPLAIYFNPAGLAAVNRHGLLLQHDISFLDIGRSDAAYAVPLAGGGLGLGVTHIDYGTITRTTTLQKSGAGTYTASDLLLRAGYARPLGDRFALGATLGHYRLAIADVTATGVTADIGSLYKPPLRGVTLGAGLRNIGARARFSVQEEELPLALVLGASYRPIERLLLAVDGEFPRNEPGVVRAGVEYRVIEALALRAGYNGANEMDNGLSLGLGVQYRDIRLDYAYVPDGDAGQSHRISAEVAFGAPAPDRRGRDREAATSPHAEREEPRGQELGQPRFVRCLPFTLRSGDPAHEWMGPSFPEVVHRDWGRSGILARSPAEADMTLEGDYWVQAESAFAVEARLVKNGRVVRSFQLHGDVAKPFLLWAEMASRVNAELRLMGLEIVESRTRRGLPAAL